MNLNDSTRLLMLLKGFSCTRCAVLLSFKVIGHYKVFVNLTYVSYHRIHLLLLRLLCSSHPSSCFTKKKPAMANIIAPVVVPYLEAQQGPGMFVVEFFNDVFHDQPRLRAHIRKLVSDIAMTLRKEKGFRIWRMQV